MYLITDRLKSKCVCVCLRYEMLQDNVEGYRKEIASLRDKTQKQAAAGQKSEQTVHTLSQDLRAANEKLSTIEVSVFMLLYVLLSSFCGFFFVVFFLFPFFSVLY